MAVVEDTGALADELFGDESTKPTSNWFAFTNVGDRIAGILLEEPYEKPGNYGVQTIYVIKTPDDSEINVALKNNTHAVQIRQLKSAEVGDTVAFKFAKEVDTGKGNLAKSIEVRIRHANKA